MIETNTMKTTPETPRECAICQRVERTLKEDNELSERLSKEEIDGLVKKVQTSVLNKSEINERGIKMSDEKYVISKASFDDFYETQDNLVSIIEKMVDRIEKQDQVIMKFGAALSELIAKNMGPEFPIEEGDGLVEEEVEFGEGDDVVGDEDEGIIEEELEEEEEEVPGEGLVAGAGVPQDDEFAAMVEKARKDAFEAGWLAHDAEVKKQNGIPVAASEIPSKGVRPIPTATAQAAVATGQVQKSFTDKELAEMTPQQLNAKLKELGL